MAQLKMVSGKTGTYFVNKKEFFSACVIKEMDQNKVVFFLEDAL